MTPDITSEEVAGRADRIRERIAGQGADPDAVTLVAVTKGFGADAVRAVVDAGLTDVGESYAQELLAKAEAIGQPAPRWHFIGRLQSNKVRPLAAAVWRWQSVDRLPLMAELARRAPGASLMVQVNVSAEPGKGGCTLDEAGGLTEAATDLGLVVTGLMAVGPAGPPEAARPGFRALSRLADRLGLPERSMGMTGDLEVAVQEGATMVRVGTALLGPRPDVPRSSGTAH